MLVARHPNRPTVLDYVNRLFTEFTEISGDRRFADDHAIVTGFARYKDEPVMIVGHHKGGGGDTKQKIFRNFGYAKPEGYRKALRAMKLAEKFGRPVIAFIDTPAAYPGVESEERGISEAIALNLREMARSTRRSSSSCTARAAAAARSGIAVGDRILMHEFAIYSVIPPEGCAAILWRDSNRKVEAAERAEADRAGSAALRTSSTRSCPSRSAARTRTPSWAATLLDTALERTLAEVSAMDSATRLEARYRKWRAMGNVGIIEPQRADRSLLAASRSRTVGDRQRTPGVQRIWQPRRATIANRCAGQRPRHRAVTARLLCIRGTRRRRCRAAVPLAVTRRPARSRSV